MNAWPRLHFSARGSTRGGVSVTEEGTGNIPSSQTRPAWTGDAPAGSDSRGAKPRMMKMMRMTVVVVMMMMMTHPATAREESL